MRDLVFSNKVILKSGGKLGEQPVGVFATENIKKGETIEESVLIFPKNDKWEDLDDNFLPFFVPIPHLRDDAKDVAEKHGGVTVLQVTKPVCASGFAMFYSRKSSGNIEFRITPQNTLIVKATRKIEKGEELFLLERSLG